jgi:hypothetical protein
MQSQTFSTVFNPEFWYFEHKLKPVHINKHPSKYKILKSKTVEEVSQMDERVDMSKLIYRSTFRRNNKKRKQNEK